MKNTKVYQNLILGVLLSSCADSVLHDRVALPGPGLVPAPNQTQTGQNMDLPKTVENPTENTKAATYQGMILTLKPADEIADEDPFEILFPGQARDAFSPEFQELNQEIKFRFEVSDVKQEDSSDGENVQYLTKVKLIFKIYDKDKKKPLATRTFVNDGDFIFNTDGEEDFMNGRFKNSDSGGKATRFIVRNVKRVNSPDEATSLENPWSGTLSLVEGSDEYTFGDISGLLSAPAKK